jgi:hypothetical protein
MRIYIEIGKDAAEKLIELAGASRRNPRQQAEWLLERALEGATPVCAEHCRTEELALVGHADR